MDNPVAYTDEKTGLPTSYMGAPAVDTGEPVGYSAQPVPYMGEPIRYTGQPAAYMGEPSGVGITSEKVAFEMVDVVPHAGSRHLKEVIKSATGFFMYTSLFFSVICVVFMPVYWNERYGQVDWFDAIYMVAACLTLLSEIMISITIAVKRNDINNKMVHIFFAGISALSALLFLIGTIGCIAFNDVRIRIRYDYGYSYYGNSYYNNTRSPFILAEIFGFITTVLLIQQMIFHIRDYKIDTRVPETNQAQQHGVKDFFMSAVGFFVTCSLVCSIFCILTISCYLGSYSNWVREWAAYMYMYASCHTLATEILILAIMLATRHGQRNSLFNKIFVALCVLCTILLLTGSICCFSASDDVWIQVRSVHRYYNRYTNNYDPYYYDNSRRSSGHVPYYVGGGIIGMVNVILLIQQTIFHVRDIQSART